MSGATLRPLILPAGVCVYSKLCFIKAALLGSSQKNRGNVTAPAGVALAGASI
jgi:hypothetical protein